VITPVSLSSLCLAARISKPRVERWISDGKFEPLEEVEIGKARAWGLQDTIRLFSFVRLVDAGCKVEVGQAIGLLHAFKGEGAYLVVKALNRRMKLPSTSDLNRLDPGWRRAIRGLGNSEWFEAHVCRHEQVLPLVDDDDVAAIFVIDLARVEAEAIDAIERAAALDGKGLAD